MKKLIILISVIIIFFIFFLYMYISPRNYKKEYEINKIKITEKYNKDKEYYYINMNYKKKNYEFVSTEPYTTKRGIIEDIEITKDNDITCLIPKSKYLTTYPICYKKDIPIAYNLANIDFQNTKNIKLQKEKYNDININYLNEKTFLIWNYKGFNYINKKNKQNIKILDNDTYNLDLVAKVDNYLLIPDYDNKHTFKKIYIIDLNDGNLKEWDLKYEIYFDSYIVGTDNKSVFLFDKKNEIEYELRPDKKKIRKIKYKAIIDDKWQNITLGELNKEVTFTRENVYNYKVIDNRLYLTYLDGKTNILISAKKIKDIVYIENESIYYLVDDKLYMYTKDSGEVYLMEYFEWNFNYKNMIHIY